VAVALFVAVVGPAWAISGRVHDPEGRPIEGANACLLLGPESIGLCVHTDAEGFYSLPGDGIPAVRISAKGYLPVDVGAVDHEDPIRLERAASFEVRVVDASDQSPVPGAKLWIVLPNGQRKGPIALSPSAWLQMNSFRPGTYRIQVEASGYVQEASPELRLRAGESEEAIVPMRRKSSPPPPRTEPGESRLR
jgi:hypothetical protein